MHLTLQALPEYTCKYGLRLWSWQHLSYLIIAAYRFYICKALRCSPKGIIGFTGLFLITAIPGIKKPLQNARAIL